MNMVRVGYGNVSCGLMLEQRINMHKGIKRVVCLPTAGGSAAVLHGDGGLRPAACLGQGAHVAPARPAGRPRPHHHAGKQPDHRGAPKEAALIPMWQDNQ